jgi:hypothetical protein
VGAANRGRGGFGEAERLHLALLDQILDGAGDILDRDVLIDAVLIIEIDRLDPQARDRPLNHAPDMLGATVETTAPRLILARGGSCRSHAY